MSVCGPRSWPYIRQDASACAGPRLHIGEIFVVHCSQVCSQQASKQGACGLLFRHIPFGTCMMKTSAMVPAYQVDTMYIATVHTVQYIDANKVCTQDHHHRIQTHLHIICSTLQKRGVDVWARGLARMPSCRPWDDARSLPSPGSSPP